MVGRPGGDPKGPKGQMGQKLKNGLFLVYSTIAEIRDRFDHFVPLWWGDPAVVSAVVGRPRCRCGGEPAVVGRPCCGGETPLWWGDFGDGEIRFQILNFRSQLLS